MQIQRLTQTQNFTKKTPDTQSKTQSKPLGWALGTVAAGGVGVAGGYKLGEKYAESRPEVTDLYKKLETIVSKTDKLNKESEELWKPLEVLYKKLEELKPRVIPAVSDVFKNVYEELLKELELPIKYKTEKPNSLMIYDKNKSLCEQIIECFKQHIQAFYPFSTEVRKVSNEVCYLDVLEELKASADKTGKYNLLHVEKLEELLNPNCEYNLIGHLKGLMDRCANEYETTILFSATNPEQLDDIAIADHRTTWVDLSPHVEEKHRAVLGEFDKYTQESEILQGKKNIIDMKIIELEREYANKKFDMETLLTKQTRKYTNRGMLLGGLIGLLSMGILGILLTRGKKKDND